MADLITLEDYKAHENLQSVKDDTRLIDIIVSVSQLVKTYCANSFVDYFDSECTEVFTIKWAVNVVQLTEAPIVAIISVEERATYNSSYTALSEGSFEYFVDSDTDSIYRTNASGFINWPLGPGAVKVVYNAGYETIPADLKLAVIDLINYYYKDEYKERRSLGTASMSNVPSSTQWRNVDFPDHIKRVLDLYKQQLA